MDLHRGGCAGNGSAQAGNCGPDQERTNKKDRQRGQDVRIAGRTGRVFKAHSGSEKQGREEEMTPAAPTSNSYSKKKLPIKRAFISVDRSFYCNNVPFVSSSAFSCSTTADATRSPSSRCSRRTPCVERPASRIVLVSMRMILPNWLISMASDDSSTSMIPTTFPFFAVVFTLMTPLPPRDCNRYSSTGVRLP